MERQQHPFSPIRNQPLNKIHLARVAAVDAMVEQNWIFGDVPGVPVCKVILILYHGDGTQ